MQRLSWILGVTGLVSLGAVQNVPPEDAAYAIGYDVGRDTVATLKADGVPVDAQRLVAGFTDAVLEREPDLDDASRRQILASLEREVATRFAQLRIKEDPIFAARAEANLERSRAFHRAYGRRPGVKTIKGGTQYRIITGADGAIPDDDSTVVATYEARLLDGTIFASEERLELRVGYLSDGAREALKRMPAGSTWELAIPPEQAFGLGGQPPVVGPNESLIIVVELLEVR